MVPSQFRQECYREQSDVKEHITLVPPVLCIPRANMDPNIVYLPELWGFARKHVITTLANSSLDPDNREETTRNEVLRMPRHCSSRSPPGYPSPHSEEYLVGASPSGNVNSEMIFNLFKDYIVPGIRKAGITRAQRVSLPWDQHTSHMTEALFEFLGSENVKLFFHISHSSVATSFMTWCTFQRSSGRGGRI